MNAPAPRYINLGLTKLSGVPRLRSMYYPTTLLVQQALDSRYAKFVALEQIRFGGAM